MVCSICHEQKDEQLFNFKNKSKGLRHTSCKDCWNRSNKLRYQQNKTYYQNKAQRRKEKLKQYIRDYKVDRGCFVCGEKHPACLDLHHNDPTTKNIEPAQMSIYGWGQKRVETELNKCTVLCANCHRKTHYAPIV